VRAPGGDAPVVWDGPAALVAVLVGNGGRLGSGEAEAARWHGEAEGLKVSLAGASHKLTQMDQITARRSAIINLGMPDFADAAGRTTTTPATLTRTRRAFHDHF
jgi:hypothetical protein